MTTDAYDAMTDTKVSSAKHDQPRRWRSGIDLAGWDITADESISRFLGCVARHLGRSSWSLGHYVSGDNTFVLLHEPNYEDEVILLIRHGRRKDTLAADLIGHSRPSEKGPLVKKWRKAIDAALQEVYTPQTGRWYTRLVVAESTQLSTGPGKLAGPGNIGAFDISPSAGPMWVRVELPSSEGYSLKTVWPVVVKCEGPLDHYQMPLAPPDLKDLRLILAIATGRHWSVQGRLLPESLVPTPEQELARQRENWDEFGEPNLNGSGVDEFSIEPWMTSGLELLKKEPTLRNAAGIFEQGLIIGLEHPSVAMLCFVSAIEAIGELDGEELSTCAECGSRVGVTKRFRSQVAKGVPEEKLRHYTDLYEKRSRIVHTSELYGVEFKSTPYDMDLDLFSKNLGFFGSVFELRETTRAILQRRLEGSSDTDARGNGDYFGKQGSGGT